MTDYYVKSGTGGTGGLTWADAVNLVESAIALASAGDRIFVSQSHSESSGSTIVWACGTTRPGLQILVVDDTGSPEPPLQSDIITTPTVTIECTATDLSLSGYYYISGIIFKANGNIMVGNSNPRCRNSAFRYCKFWLTNTSANKSLVSAVTSGGMNQTVIAEDCVVRYERNSHAITASSGRGTWHFIRLSFDITTTQPTNILAGSGVFFMTGCDFSNLSSSAVMAFTSSSIYAVFYGCKLNATTSIPSSLGSSQYGQLISCGAGDEVYNYVIPSKCGSASVDTGIYLNGTISGTNASLNITSTADTFVFGSSNRVTLCNIDSVNFSSSKTFTVEFARDGSTTPYTNAELWLEVQYHDITDNALIICDTSSKCEIMATPSNLTSSGASWTGLSGTNNKMKIAVTISSTVAATGPVTIIACFGPTATATDLYADPAVTVS